MELKDYKQIERYRVLENNFDKNPYVERDAWSKGNNYTIEELRQIKDYLKKKLCLQLV